MRAQRPQAEQAQRNQALELRLAVGIEMGLDRPGGKVWQWSVFHSGSVCASAAWVASGQGFGRVKRGD